MRKNYIYLGLFLLLPPTKDIYIALRISSLSRRGVRRSWALLFFFFLRHNEARVFQENNLQRVFYVLVNLARPEQVRGSD